MSSEGEVSYRRRDFRSDRKRFTRKVSRLNDKVDELRARLEKSEEALREVAGYYACDCPEYVRDNCEKKRCGSYASDIADQIADYERWKDVSSVLAQQSKAD